MIRISVIILNYNGKKLLKECLDSLRVQSFRQFEAILVDNGSSDGSVDYLRENYPWVRIVALSENLGFAGGNNRGFAVSCGEYIVTLNNDTKVSENFLEELLKVAEKSCKTGIVAAKMLDYHKRDMIDSVGIYPASNGTAVSIGAGEADRGQYDRERYIFGACAGAALYRRSMISETGFFDPEFFAYYEDMDLAWRAVLAGWRALAAPKGVAYHIHSATSGRMSDFTVYHTHRNKWRTIVKNWPFPLIARHLPEILLHDAASILLAAVKGRGWAAIKARISVIADFRAILEKRREIRKLVKIPARKANALLLPPPSPWKIFRRKMRSGA